MSFRPHPRTTDCGKDGLRTLLMTASRRELKYQNSNVANDEVQKRFHPSVYLTMNEFRTLFEGRMMIVNDVWVSCRSSLKCSTLCEIPPLSTIKDALCQLIFLIFGELGGLDLRT